MTYCVELAFTYTVKHTLKKKCYIHDEYRISHSSTNDICLFQKRYSDQINLCKIFKKIITKINDDDDDATNNTNK